MIDCECCCGMTSQGLKFGKGHRSHAVLTRSQFTAVYSHAFARYSHTILSRWPFEMRVLLMAVLLRPAAAFRLPLRFASHLTPRLTPRRVPCAPTLQADPEPGACPKCADTGTYWDGMANFACTACGHEWAVASVATVASGAAAAADTVVRDSNGNVLAKGDTVVLIKDLAKGALKKGTKCVSRESLDATALRYEPLRPHQFGRLILSNPTRRRRSGLATLAAGTTLSPRFRARERTC
jgi:alkylphosphonate utilization operon protein PhnA